MKEGHVILICNFSGGLKQNKEFDTILFFTRLFILLHCSNNKKPTNTFNKRKPIPYFTAGITEKNNYYLKKIPSTNEIKLEIVNDLMTGVFLLIVR